MSSLFCWTWDCTARHCVLRRFCDGFHKRAQGIEWCLAVTGCVMHKSRLPFWRLWPEASPGLITAATLPLVWQTPPGQWSSFSHTYVPTCKQVPQSKSRKTTGLKKLRNEAINRQMLMKSSTSTSIQLRRQYLCATCRLFTSKRNLK